MNFNSINGLNHERETCPPFTRNRF
ncbi:putative translational regulatory protein ArgL [Vagococcus sp. WN89Y]